MLSNYLGPLPLGFAAFRLIAIVAALFALAVLWRRPRAGAAFWGVVALNLAAWAAYCWPLQRLYALDEGGDRAFNAGMAAGVAVGRSPFAHTQVGFGSPEPLWNLLTAALAGFAPERVLGALHLLAPLAILGTAAGLYFGMRTPVEADGDRTQDDWERVLVVFAAFAFASLSMNPRPPVPALWAANFLLKPHHALAWALLGVMVGQLGRARPRVWVLAGVLGLLSWVFLIHWAYVVAGLLGGLLLFRDDRTSARTRLAAILASALVAAPYVAHLMRDYRPTDESAAAQHMWDDPRGLPLAVPTWTTLDLGVLFVLGLLGAAVLWRRRAPRDRVLLGVLATTWLLFVLSMPGALFGLAPEPDELHYFLRFVTALSAGTALAAGARHLEAQRGWIPGRGPLAMIALCLPLSFVAYWDPPSMDRYYPVSLEPIRPKILEYGAWVREHTPAEARFVGGRSSATWIPVLAGRQVLRNPAGKLQPRDLTARQEVERVLLTSGDAAQIRQAAARYGITHVAVDESLVQTYGAGSFHELARGEAFQELFANAAVRIVAVR
jgi:hypothetical protein